MSGHIGRCRMPRIRHDVPPLCRRSRLPAQAAKSLDTPRLMAVALLSGFSMISCFDGTIMSIAGPIVERFRSSRDGLGVLHIHSWLCPSHDPWRPTSDRFGPRSTIASAGPFRWIRRSDCARRKGRGLGAYLGIVPLLAIRLGIGVVTTPLYSAWARMTANSIAAPYHARIRGLVMAGSSVGAPISPPLYTWMPVQFGWRISFVIAACANAGSRHLLAVVGA